MNKKPSDFRKHPYNSVFNNSEHEVVARNIMIILSKGANEFRELSWNEYKVRREQDGNFCESEKKYFDEVILYCKNADTAILFSPTWKE